MTTPPSNGGRQGGPESDGDHRREGHDWEVRSARVAALTPEVIVLLTGDWHAPDALGACAMVRRFGPDGLAEWEGAIGAQEALYQLDYGALAAIQAAPEAAVVVELPAGGGAGHIYQRRRAARLPTGLIPVRVTPLPAGHRFVPGMMPGETPGHAPQGARLADVSAVGAGVVVSAPLRAGATVALEFQLPGGPAPFALWGRVVEPAYGVPAELQPQADGVPGYRFGIEFIGTDADRELHRLALVLDQLLSQHPTEQESGSRRSA